MVMSQMTVAECPLCFKHFSKTFIQSHVEVCLEKVNRDCKTPAKRMRLCDASQTQSCVSACLNEASSSASSSNSKSVSVANDYSVSSDKAQVTNDTVLDQVNAFFTAKPLADLARPSCISDFVGQLQVLQDGTILHKLMKSAVLPSMIFWGPPGCGKTTLVRILAGAKQQTGVGKKFVKMSATNSGKADVQSVIKVAKNDLKMFRRKTIIFIDEIHRFNKLQQDTFLPHVEDGTIVLLGATTENPSFALNSALLSRCHVIVLEKLASEHIETMLTKAINQHLKFCSIVTTTDDKSHADTPLESDKVHIQQSALQALGNLCNGDARVAFNALQIAIQDAATVQDSGTHVVTVEHINASLQRNHLLYDKMGDEHYHTMSALQKSVRGSDDNASLYWLTRMMLGGEDPKVIARRLIRIAGEDIGLADPMALTIALSTYQSCLYVGMPECDVVLAECVTYLARAPKSNEVYKALENVKESIRSHKGPLPGVPLHLRNPSTQLAREMGYGKGYKYHTKPSEQVYLPDDLKNVNFFNK